MSNTLKLPIRALFLILQLSYLPIPQLAASNDELRNALGNTHRNRVATRVVPLEEIHADSSIVNGMIALPVIAYGLQHDAQTQERARIHAAQAACQQEAEILKQQKAQLEQEIFQREKKYRELCQREGIEESSVDKFYYVYGHLSKLDWAIYFAPNPDAYLAGYPPLFSNLELFNLSSFRAFMEEEWGSSCQEFFSKLDLNSEKVARAEAYSRGSFSPRAYFAKQKELILEKEQAYKEQLRTCCDGAFYPNWGNAIGSPDLKIEPHYVPNPPDPGVLQELRKLDSKFEHVLAHHFNSRQFKVYFDPNDIPWHGGGPCGPEILLADDFRLWRYPEFRAYLQSQPGYKDLIKNVNFRGKEVLEAEKYMPEGFGLREHLRQEKIRLLTPEERAQWQASYAPSAPQAEAAQPVESSAQAHEQTATVSTSYQCTIPHLFEHEYAYLDAKKTHYQEVLEHNSTLSEAQRTRLTELVQLIDNPNQSRALIRDLLQQHQRKAIDALAHWDQAIPLDEQGVLFQANKELLALAQRHNDNGLITEALNATDACLTLLDAAEATQGYIFTKDADAIFNQVLDLYQSIPRPLRVFMGDVVSQGAMVVDALCPGSGDAIERGVWRGMARGTQHFVQHTAEAVRHPIETAQKLVRTLGHVCACLDHYILQDKLLHTFRDAPVFSDFSDLSSRFEQLHLKYQSPLGSGTRETASPTPIQQLFDQELHERAQWGTLWDLCCEKYQLMQQWQESTPLEQKVETVTAALTEQLLTIGSSHVIGTTINQTGNNLAQAVRTAADTSQRVALVGDGTVIVRGVAEAETLADAIANAGQLVGRATQAAGQASLVSQRNAEHEPQGSSTRPPLDDAQAIEQRAEKIAQHSEIEYKKDLLKKESARKRTQVSVSEIHQELSYELRIVQKAEQELAGVAGLEETIQSFETQAANGRFAQAKGASFELEVAMKVSQEEPILGLGVKAGGREIDIVTPTRYIECKNLDWELPNMISKTQNQLGRLNRLANTNNKIITLHSKNQIPASLKSWCNSRGIQYCEGLI